MKIFQGDCLELMQKIEDNAYTGIISDVPYGLKFMGKKMGLRNSQYFSF